MATTNLTDHLLRPLKTHPASKGCMIIFVPEAIAKGLPNGSKVTVADATYTIVSRGPRPFERDGLLIRDLGLELEAPIAAPTPEYLASMEAYCVNERNQGKRDLNEDF